MPRARRKTHSLHMEERAVIRTWSVQAGEPTPSIHYATTMDITSRGLQIYSRTLLPVGEVLEIDITLQGQAAPHPLKGVARSVSLSGDQPGYVVDVELVADNAASFWRRQFN